MTQKPVVEQLLPWLPMTEDSNLKRETPLGLPLRAGSQAAARRTLLVRFIESQVYQGVVENIRL
jgi:F-type H+-transporting ATPase subunit gamma